MRIGLLIFSLMWLTLGDAVAATRKVVYGYVEKVVLVDKQLTLSAKLDTGAKTASLSAINIREVKEKGKTYLQFMVPSKVGNIPFKAEYFGRVSIKPRVGERTLKRKPIRRPLVMVRIKLGGVERKIAMNLTNRKRFNYPILLGRDALNAFDAVVDPSAAFLLKKKIVTFER